MPSIPHVEKHFTAGEIVRDVVIGMSDGLTVPFALAAGLTGAISDTRLIVTAGMAEIAAGAIAMGLGGYLAARGDSEHYVSERLREVREVETVPDIEAREIQDIFRTYGVTDAESAPIMNALQRSPEKWVDFMMRFELGLEEPEPKRAIQSALTIASSYIVGGIIPLSPYLLIHTAPIALRWSAVVTLIALGIFGFIKGRVTGTTPSRSALQTVVIGGLAATVAFLLAKAFS